MALKDGGIILKFKNAETDLYSYDALAGFEIAGDDNFFYPAKAKIIVRDTVFVKSDTITNPVAVRYAWRNWAIGILYDPNLLPAPFIRTKEWDDAEQSKKN